ncbi:MAG: type III secretion system export apparatus subunit SctV [Hyphomicrobiales bacterium]|nr:type III secretion system export apparatus subunit SctV [Hyphomicrobiales bacterium]
MNSITMLNTFLRVVGGRQDLIVILFIIVGIGAMILPITPGMADILIAVNISVSALLLMVAFYIRSPAEFSSLPSVILISTVFRLSISIASTRLILIEADGGQIVQTFGDFVIGGNAAVGLVVFFIITIVQFLVITKGSERVAEVAARFSLDGLPGKQMSIDSDLRNGDTDQTEARRRRQLLERESQLYGAMDGAMKFVKGDAIASIIIIIINLGGGIAVGMLQRGMPFGEAVQVFSLLTIGEGLIAQIPSLFISLAAGTIVTRVHTGTGQNLGADIVAQVAGRPEALRLAGFVLIGLAMVPGFPAPVFLVLGGLIGGSGFFLLRRDIKKAAHDASMVFSKAMSAEVAAHLPSPTGARVNVIVSSALFTYFADKKVDQKIRAIVHAAADDLGFATPSIGYRIDASFPAARYIVELDMVPEIVRDVEISKLYIKRNAAKLLGAASNIISADRPKSAHEFLAVDESAVAELRNAAIRTRAVHELIETDVASLLRQNAAQFVGFQETRRLLLVAEIESKDLVREAQRIAPVQRIADVLRRLLEEGIPIRNMRLILETILDWAPREQDTVALAGHVRTALRRQICFQYANENRLIPVLMIERELEDNLREAYRQALGRQQQSIDLETASAFIETLTRQTANIQEQELTNAVIMVSPDLRRLLWMVISQSDQTYPVLSHKDIVPGFSVKVLVTIGQSQQGQTPLAQLYTPELTD